MVIRWEDPPAGSNQAGRGWTNDTLRELATRPNEWAVVAEGVIATPADRTRYSNKSSNLKTVAARRGIEIEAHYRYTPEDKTVRIYARFIKEVPR